MYGIHKRTMIRNRLRRLRVLREYGAPKWIIKNEQVSLLRNRYVADHCWTLFQRHVEPIMGQGSITLPGD